MPVGEVAASLRGGEDDDIQHLHHPGLCSGLRQPVDAPEHSFSLVQRKEGGGCSTPAKQLSRGGPGQPSSCTGSTPKNVGGYQNLLNEL